MTPTLSQAALEDQIGQWRAFVRRRGTIQGPDVEELESHLRDQVAGLTDAGLSADEAFLVAVKRLGSLDSLSREFARAHSDRLWKQLVVGHADDRAEVRGSRAELAAVLALAVAAAVAVKVPELLFGIAIQNSGNDAQVFYLRHASFFVLPLLTLYFVWKRGLGAAWATRLAVPFIVAAAIVNLYAFPQNSDTRSLMVLHLPIALWLAVGVAYVGGHWWTGSGRMDFVRFSGELFIYYVLIALGGGVLTAFTVLMFGAIQVDAEWFVGGWLLPCGAAGAVLVASWLVEAKQSVIENMAPVLTRLFTPLFTAVLLVVLGTMAWTGKAIDTQREVLIAFDLLLAVVLGLVLYAVSARDADAPPDLFDALQLLLVVSALIVNTLALIAIAGRLAEFGLTPNRAAALGENLLLLVNLAWSAWLYARFLWARQPFAALERWQVNYLPLYAIWAATVALLFPPLFGYR